MNTIVAKCRQWGLVRCRDRRAALGNALEGSLKRGAEPCCAPAQQHCLAGQGAPIAPLIAVSPPRSGVASAQGPLAELWPPQRALPPRCRCWHTLGAPGPTVWCVGTRNVCWTSGSPPRPLRPPSHAPRFLPASQAPAGARALAQAEQFRQFAAAPTTPAQGEQQRRESRAGGACCRRRRPPLRGCSQSPYTCSLFRVQMMMILCLPPSASRSSSISSS